MSRFLLMPEYLCSEAVQKRCRLTEKISLRRVEIPVVSAIQAYAKINSAGQWIERTEQINLNDLFAKMSAEELESYAKDGTLPDWFTDVVGATPSNDREDKGDG